MAAGQTVTRGQALLTLVPDPLARNALQQAQSALSLARGELARAEQLAAQRLATQSQLAAARKALADAEATLAAQRALGGGGASETVAAPADGVVSALNVGLGERVAANAPLLGFVPARALVARLGAQPEDGSKLHVGMPVRLRSVYGTGEVRGWLSVVGQAIDPQTHLLPLQAEFPADRGAGWVAGAALQATIETRDYMAWAVPRAAVLRDERGSYVFVIGAGHARRVDVVLRHADGDPLGVDGALDAQAKVIVSGAYELKDGDAVQEATR